MGFRPNDESCLLAYQGRSALAQGDQRRARVLFTRALRTARAAGDLSAAVGRTWALHGLGLLAHYTGDEREAERLARQALRMAQESWQRRAARFALRLLGHALFGQGKLKQAKSAYQQVLEIDQTLGYRHLAVEATADLARMALAEGDLARATASTDAVLAYWAEHTLEGTEEPIGVYRTCYAVLRAAQDPRATDVLARGHTLLQERAAQFDDEDRRRLFLANVPAHLWLRHLWEDRQSRQHGGDADAIPQRVSARPSHHEAGDPGAAHRHMASPPLIRGRPRARCRPAP
jgi:tetratricopeptide (TPR) repeat protein